MTRENVRRILAAAGAALPFEHRLGPFVLVTGFALVLAGLAKLEVARR